MHRRTLTLLACLFFATASPAQDRNLHLKYLGTAGWEIRSENTTILIDPYISRIKLGAGPSISPEDTRRSFARTDYFESDTALIDTIIREADYILVHHSHFDHLSDVPYIARKTGAKVIGTETTCNILRAYGIPDDQLYTVKGGEDYQFAEFSVRVIPSLHSALRGKLYFDSRVYREPPPAPLKIQDFVEGGLPDVPGAAAEQRDPDGGIYEFYRKRSRRARTGHLAARRKLFPARNLPLYRTVVADRQLSPVDHPGPLG